MGGYDALTYSLDLRNVLKFDRNVVGQPLPYALPLTKGYFNGCVLTITSGPAAGQSTQILEYEYIGEQVAATTNDPITTATRLFRFRVMAFSRKDGQTLAVDPTPISNKGRMPGSARSWPGNRSW